MGGLGSGRTGGKTRADQTRKIDIRNLHRKGALQKGCFSYISWYSRGQQIGEISIYTKEDQVLLSYSTRIRGESENELIREQVSLTWTPCNFGGYRPWFLCPACHKRIAVLYGSGKLFLCRHCYNIVHDSVNEGHYDRALRKSRKLRRRLGTNEITFGTNPTKPKGMHQHTFSRLRYQLSQIEGEMAARLAKVLGITF